MNAGNGNGNGTPRRASFWQTMRTVGWSFFGVRKSSAHERDLSHANPVHLIVAGVFGAVLFIVLLLLLVNWVLSSGVAG